MVTFTVDNKTYDVDSLSKQASETYALLLFSQSQVRELIDMNAVFSRAKNSYIQELRLEISKAQSGVDLSSIFEGN